MVGMKTSIRVENVSKRYRIGSVARLNLSDEIVYRLRKLIGVNPDVLSKVDKVKQSRDFWALKNVSFEVKRGEAVAIIGSNGAGKSTMLKILSRITSPTEGRILINGRVGTMLELGTGFHPEMTGRENIFLNGAILGMSNREIKQKLDSIVDFSGIARFIDTPVKRYSSGMYVRLAFSVASHLEPDVLIVDEVLSVGDADFQSKCIEQMKQITSQSKTTVIFVSHSMPNVIALCARSIWLDNGQVRMDGNTPEVTDAYLQNQPSPSLTVNESLRTRKDRSGDGHWRAVDATMLYDTEAGQWNFVLEYESEQTEIIGSGLVVAIRRDGIAHRSVTVLDSFCMGGLPERIPGKGKIRVAFSHDFSLAPGNYSCDLVCKTRNNKTGRDSFSDQIKHALSFKVDDFSVFGWRRLPFTPGITFVNQTWSVEGCHEQK